MALSDHPDALAALDALRNDKPGRFRLYAGFVADDLCRPLHEVAQALEALSVLEAVGMIPAKTSKAKRAA